MNSGASFKRRKVPYNPTLRELIKGKLEASISVHDAAVDAGFRGWHERGYLPHRDAPGLTQFLTFRLKNSFPKELRAEWAALFEIENDRERRLQLEQYLDLGRGTCILRRPDIAKLVEDSLLLFHNDRYVLQSWVVMPNHVHVLVETCTSPLATIVEGWKSCTARSANKALHRTGALWQRDYWDTFMRDGEHVGRAIRYIENNPVKAGLAAYPHESLWSSARYRSQDGTLHFPNRNPGIRPNTALRESILALTHSA